MVTGKNIVHRNECMLTARQVARLLNVHINTVRRWSNRGMLTAYRIGARGDRRFKREDIDAMFIGSVHPGVVNYRENLHIF